MTSNVTSSSLILLLPFTARSFSSSPSLLLLLLCMRKSFGMNLFLLGNPSSFSTPCISRASDVAPIYLKDSTSYGNFTHGSILAPSCPLYFELAKTTKTFSGVSIDNTSRISFSSYFCQYESPNNTFSGLNRRTSDTNLSTNSHACSVSEYSNSICEICCISS